MSFLEIQNAKVARDGKTILNISNLEIETGEQVAILGPNGAGKSTLLKLLCGDIYPLYRAKPPVKLFGSKHWDLFSLRNKMAVISANIQEQYQNHGECTGEEIILSGLFGGIGLHNNHVITAKQKQSAKRIAGNLELTRLLKKTVNTFSSGELRRFMIGRALINNPQVIVLDEPTVSLDIKARANFLQNIRALIRRKHSVIMVTHLPEEIVPEIQRVILLKNGKIYADGAKEKILTGKLLSEVFDLPIKVEKTGGYYAVSAN